MAVAVAVAVAVEWRWSGGDECGGNKDLVAGAWVVARAVAADWW